MSAQQTNSQSNTRPYTHWSGGMNVRYEASPVEQPQVAQPPVEGVMKCVRFYTPWNGGNPVCSKWEKQQVQEGEKPSSDASVRAFMKCMGTKDQKAPPAPVAEKPIPSSER
jgi:hypothetical protein